MSTGEAMVRVRLIPVEVFGGMQFCPSCDTEVEWGYGLCDAVQAWSDCNRAIGHIYRVDDDYTEGYRTPGDNIVVYVPRSEMAKFARRVCDETGGACQGCRRPLTELPGGHRARVVCEVRS